MSFADTLGASCSVLRSGTSELLTVCALLEVYQLLRSELGLVLSHCVKDGMGVGLGRVRWDSEPEMCCDEDRSSVQGHRSSQ